MENKFHRRSIRIKSWDYSDNGWYFVTINTDKGKYLLGKVENGKMMLSNLGRLVETEWMDIPNNYPHVDLDTFQVMPNHVHGIIVVDKYLNNFVGAGLAPAQRATARVAPTLGQIIGGFKSKCVVENLNYIKQNNLHLTAKFWQRNYFEHVIRNETELSFIQQYILNNPLKWHLDKNNLESKIPLKKRGEW